MSAEPHTKPHTKPASTIVETIRISVLTRKRKRQAGREYLLIEDTELYQLVTLARKGENA